MFQLTNFVFTEQNLKNDAYLHVHRAYPMQQYPSNFDFGTRLMTIDRFICLFSNDFQMTPDLLPVESKSGVNWFSLISVNLTGPFPMLSA